MRKEKNSRGKNPRNKRIQRIKEPEFLIDKDTGERVKNMFTNNNGKPSRERLIYHSV